MANSKALEEAIELVKKATVADNEQKYEEALALYKQAIKLFLQVCKDEATKRSVREAIKRKCQQYLERAEAIKQMVSGNDVSEMSYGTNTSVKPERIIKHPTLNFATAVCVTKEEESGGASGDVSDKDEKEKTLNAGNIVHGLKHNVKWDDVAGLQQAKEVLKETVILPLKFPQLFTGARRPFRRGILLYGPSGSGKTYLARAVATEADATLFSLEASHLMCPWIGDGKHIIRDVFELAKANNPAIILIEELENIFNIRNDREHEAARRLKTELLVQMLSADHGIVVLGVTNVPWQLDYDIRRTFEKRIYIPLPEEDARKCVFELNIGKIPCDITTEDLNQLAKMTEGYSGADINVVVQEAMMMPIRKVQMATHFKKVRGPKPSDPTEIVDDLYTPCSPQDPDAKEMSWMEIPGDKLCTQRVTLSDFVTSIQHTRPTIDEGWLKQFVDFKGEFE